MRVVYKVIFFLFIYCIRGEGVWIIGGVIVVLEIAVLVIIVEIDVVVQDVMILFLLGCFGWLEIWLDVVDAIGWIDMIGLGVNFYKF